MARMVARTTRFGAEHIRLLKRLAEKMLMTESNVIRHAVLKLAESQGIKRSGATIEPNRSPPSQ